MINIQVQNGDVDKALRILKKIMNNEGILQEVRERRYYTKPSQRRHEHDKQIKRERSRNKRRKK